MRVSDWFEFYARNQPEAPFAVQGGRTLTWAEADAATARLGARLLQAGVGRGGRFGYLSKNSIEMTLMYVAAARTGAVPVPLNYRLAPVEWAYIVGDAGCRVVLAQDEFAAGVDTVRDQLGGAELVLLDGAREGWAPVTAWLDETGSDQLPDEVTAGDVLYQIYTSGTTGRPKGVLLTQENVLANLHQVAATWSSRLGPQERMLVCTPMYHVSGAVAAIATATWGLTLVIHADFDPAAVVADLDEGGVVNTTLVPVMIQACLAVPGVEERRFEKLRTISYGAAPITQALMNRAHGVFGCELVQGFGQTEASSCITMLTSADHDAAATRPELLGSVGRPLPGTKVRIVDPATDEELPTGEVGEIVTRGPQVMQGYWKAPEQTAATLRGGWLHTGDAGYVDADGYVYIQDRIKDMIVTGGSNVYSVEVELVVATHPKVREAAVIGVPDETWGETVLAVVTLHEGESLTLEELQAHCRESLGGYKVPRRLEVADALPRNPSGKVLKHVLREPHWAGRERRVS